ncbi:MAG: methionyl-tRNA formyltransferase [Alphaproteobacteria bacterium]
MGLKIIFMGTPEFAVPALNELLESDHQVVAVYSQPPRPAGRGMALKKSPVQLLAEKNDLPVFTPANFKDAKDIAEFQNLNADIAVVAAYGLLLPEANLNAPKHGCINIHASLLPRWRGAAPIQYAILKGDEKSGISIMQVEKGLDTGPVLAVEEFSLNPDETATSLHDKLAELGGEMIVATLEDFTAGKITPKPQDNKAATHAPKIKKPEALINWQKPAREIDRQVRALNPNPGAFFLLDGVRVRVLEGEIKDRNGAPGEVLDETLLIACGQGSYQITRLQKEGKKPMTAPDFLRGQAVPEGTRLQVS